MRKKHLWVAASSRPVSKGDGYFGSKHGVCGEHFLLGAIQRNEHESNVYQVFTTCREPHMPKRVSGNSKLG